MAQNSPIGFFDSGVGGLSVYTKFRKVLPCENTIYFGDLKNLPYGNKTQSELIGFAGSILDFFKTKKAKAVVIACNTSSALAYESIKDNYDFKLYPIIQSCAKVISSQNSGKIGIFATSGTVSVHAYTKEISRYNPLIKVKEIACPDWVSIVESGVLQADKGLGWKEADSIKTHLNEMAEFEPDKIILGCTHYPCLIPILEKLAPGKIFIDPAEIFVEYIKNDLTANNLLRAVRDIGSEDFYVSAEPETFYNNAHLFYDLKELPHLIQPAAV